MNLFHIIFYKKFHDRLNHKIWQYRASFLPPHIVVVIIVIVVVIIVVVVIVIVVVI